MAPLRIGIGIHTGEVFAGNVGGAGKVKYAVVGDTVNRTSLVEGLNKEFGTTILMTGGDASRRRARDVGQRPGPHQRQGETGPRATL